MARSFERCSSQSLIWSSLLCLMAACGSGPRTGEEPPPSVPQKENELRDILSFESQRNPEARPPVVALTRSSNPILRAMAVRALGRAGGPANTDLLLMSLGDPDPRVQKEALFALGQTQGVECRTKAEGLLLSKLSQTDPASLTLVLEALGKLLDAEDEARILPYLESPDASVVAAASLALHRIRTRSLRSDTKRSEKADEILAAALGKALTGKQSPEAEWRLVYTLASIESRSSIDDLLRALRSSRALWSRLFAIRGLANMKRESRKPLDAKQDEEFRALLLKSLRDPNPLIVIEATLAASDPSRFGRNSSPADTEAPYQDGEMFSAIKQLLIHDNSNVVAAAVLGIGHFTVMKRKARAALGFEIASEDRFISAHGIEAMARLQGRAFTAQLELSSRDESWLVQVAVAHSLRFVDSRSALPIAHTLFGNPAKRGTKERSPGERSNVQIAVLKALVHHGDHPASLEMGIEALDANDPALRESGAELLGRIGVAGDEKTLAALRRAFLGSEGFEFSDARHAIVKTLSELGRRKPGTRTFLVEAMKDGTWLVRKAAHAALEKNWSAQPVPSVRKPETVFPPHLPPSSQLAAFLTSRPRIALETSRGRMVIELWPYEAPGHCYNLLQFIRSHKYDGRILHRVVPNFVVQGGDHLGNGYGSRSFTGARLRDEINPHPFLQGTLGMPKSAEPDSGGEQVFFSLVPTPHLDGRYTSFGRVVEGLDVLEKLRLGDEFLSCSVLHD